MTDYILSIIIPTRNRQTYCKAAICQILDHEWEGVEICIQDNSEDDSLRAWVASLHMSNVVYNYHSGILSFVDNFSEAVSLAHGKYLCMIGDDDGVLPSLVRLAEKMEIENADAAIPALSFIYFWPSNQHIVENSEKGVLISHLYSEQPESSTKVINGGEDGLKKLLQNGIQNYYSYDIPRLYHGIVRREVLDTIKASTGHYFGGLTPDMYMAVALSLTCKKVLRVNYSVTISGICPTSGSSDSATGKHTGELKDAPHFRGHETYEWDELIPAFYSVDTIWADTLLHALKEFGRVDLEKFFNLSLFSGLCINTYPEYSCLLLQHAKDYGCTVRGIKLNLAIYKMRVLLKRIKGKILRSILRRGLGKNNLRKEGVSDIRGAEMEIMNIYKEHQKLTMSNK